MTGHAPQRWDGRRAALVTRLRRDVDRLGDALADRDRPLSLGAIATLAARLDDARRLVWDAPDPDPLPPPGDAGTGTG